MDPPVARVPGPLLRAALRVPVAAYRSGLGGALGGRFMMITHRGRRSGLVRRTVVEVVHHDPDVPEWVAVSGFGPRAAWWLNITAAPAMLVQVGGREFVPHQRLLDEPERRLLLATYQREHPRAARLIGRVLWDEPFDGSEETISRLAAALPAVAFRPAPPPRGNGTD